MSTYYFTLTPDDNDTFLIQFPDIPEAAAVAETMADAHTQAAEGLEVALQMHIDARRPIPTPSFKSEDNNAIRLGIHPTAKTHLSNQMVAKGIKKAELARRMGLHAPQIDRLLNLGHSSKIETIEAAMELLDGRFELSLA